VCGREEEEEEEEGGRRKGRGCLPRPFTGSDGSFARGEELCSAKSNREFEGKN